MVAVGTNHTCVLVNPGGRIKCWGANVNGQLGYGDISWRNDVTALSPVAF